MKSFISKHAFALVGIIIGGIGGFLYWKYVGCLSGSCPLQSNANIMVGHGLFFGYTLSSLAKDGVEKIKGRK